MNNTNAEDKKVFSQDELQVVLSWGQIQLE